MADFPTDHNSLDPYPSTFEAPFDFVPQRVVSLVPSLTEALFDLDIGDRLVAITTDCAHPANQVQSLLKVGSPSQPDIDTIVSLQPDLVLFNSDENDAADQDALQAANVPVWVTTTRTVFDALNLLWHIMHFFDHSVMVPRVREIERAYDYTNGAARAQTPVPVFAAIFETQPGAEWQTANADTFTHDMLRVCGGANVFADLPDRYPAITLEDIEAQQPVVVLLPDTMATENVDTIRTLDIPAAQAAHIYQIDSTLLTWHGTRIGFALRDLPGLIMETE